MHTMNEEYENDDKSEEEVEDSGFMSYEELMQSRKISFSDVKEHLTGPVISTLVHVLVLSFLGTIIVFKAPEKAKEITVEMKKIEPTEIEPPPPPPEPPEPTDVQTPTDTPIERPNMEVDVDVKVDNISVNNTSDVQLPSVLNMKTSNSALTLPVNPGGGGGGPVGGKFLGTGGTGSRFAFVLDYSASMGGHTVGNKKIDVMEEHLVKALEGFRGKGQVCIILFAGGGWLLDGEWPVGKIVPFKSGSGKSKRPCRRLDPAKLNPRWIVPNKHNLEILKKLIYETETLYGTDWSAGMDIALNYLKPAPDVVFFMTDGKVSEVSAKNTLDMVKAAKAKKKNLVVNVIAFGLTDDGGSSKKSGSSAKSKNGDPSYYLPEIAKVGGGQYKVFTSADIKAMSDVKKITKYDAEGKLDYSPPPKTSSKTLPKERKMTDLIIE